MSPKVRGMRGGAFVGSPVTDLLASSRNNSALYSGEPTNEGDALGFRISQIPVIATLAHAGDANNDGAVDVIDLGILAQNYDWVGPPAGAIPEPATLGLLAMGGIAMLRRRK